jgi:hypothetical protein
LLHLLGLKVPDGALTGLDGVLIGLRKAGIKSLDLLAADGRQLPNQPDPCVAPITAIGPP